MLNSDFLGVILAASLASVAFVPVARAQLDQGVNQQDGALLCRVYQIASRTIEKFAVPQEVQAYVDKIDLINMSLADESWVNGLETAGGGGNIKEGGGDAPAADETLRRRWDKAVEAIKKGSITKDWQVSLSPFARRKASKKLRRIEEKVDVLLKSIHAFSTDNQVDTINSHFNEAIYGKGSHAGDPTMGWNGKGSTRATDCAVAGLGNKGTLAGDSIGIDLYCLCVPESSSDLQSACGVDSGNGGSNAWTASTIVDGSGAMWKALRQYCSTYPRPNSTADARKTLQEFLARLAGGGSIAPSSTKESKPGLLGASRGRSSNAGCDGHKGTSTGNGICVYYGSNDWEDKIAWFRKIKEALDEQETIETKEKNLQSDINDLKRLKERAEEIYEEAQIASETDQHSPEKSTENANQKQITANPTDKATTQEPASVNSAFTTRFILPWTLLI